MNTILLDTLAPVSRAYALGLRIPCEVLTTVSGDPGIMAKTHADVLAGEFGNVTDAMRLAYAAACYFKLDAYASAKR